MEKAQYAILRFAKYKGPEIGRIEAHDERTKEKYASNPDVDTSRSSLNFHLVKPHRSYRAEAEKQIAEAGCRAKKDSVRVVETLITASPEFFANKKPKEVKKFFEYALEFIQSKQSPETIISAVVHVDEKTPHMHLSKKRIQNDEYELYDGLHESIITEGQWERVKAAQKQRNHNPVNADHTNHPAYPRKLSLIGDRRKEPPVEIGFEEGYCVPFTG